MRHPVVIPLVHDFEGETVLVFGGGTVGARRAARLAREARVIVVSPRFADAEFGGSEFVRAAPGSDDVPGWLDAADPALVVAATDDAALNAAIECHAAERGTLVNRADRGGERDRYGVVVPATVADGPVEVAITTGATSPAVSGHLREELEPVVAGAGLVATVVGDLRERLQGGSSSPSTRRDAIRAVAGSADVWAVARETGDEERVRAVAERVLSEAVDGADQGV